MEVENHQIYCPYCGEPLSVLVDPGDIGSSYVEDCQVCCQPMVLHPESDGSGSIELRVMREDD